MTTAIILIVMPIFEIVITVILLNMLCKMLILIVISRSTIINGTYINSVSIMGILVKLNQNNK